MGLMGKMTRGDVVQEQLTLIEGWTFAQMRKLLAEHSGLEHDAARLSDKALLEKVGATYDFPEGLFFPDTYQFAKGTSELQIYRQAYTEMRARLQHHWAQRDKTLPYKSAYEALIMASIVEKETGASAERDMIAGVFVNRLKKGMLLQTDPSVIYGMGCGVQRKQYTKARLAQGHAVQYLYATRLATNADCIAGCTILACGVPSCEDKGVVFRGARRWWQPVFGNTSRA